jgi:serine/threonine-protein kinase RsbW
MSHTHRITRSAELESIAAFRDFIDTACARAHIDAQTCYDMKLAVDEACDNIITHGYAGMNPGSIMLELHLHPTRAVMTITDFGHPFEPYEPEAPDLVAAMASDQPVSGFGLFFIYRVMDSVDYQTTEDGNRLVLVKRLPQVPA